MYYYIYVVLCVVAVLVLADSIAKHDNQSNT